MDILLPVFQLLYFVAHFLVSLCQAVHDALYDLYRIASELIRWLLHTPSKGPFVNGKSPEHPILLLLPGQYKSSQLHQVANVLSALARSGASCLTVYEAAGKLRGQQWALQELLQKALPGFNVHLIPDETANDSRHEHRQHSSDGSSQMSGEVLLLRVVSLESGSRLLLSSVHLLAREAGPNNVVDITCEALHSFLATPACTSCWRPDIGEGRSLIIDCPIEQQVTSAGNCLENNVQMTGNLESTARMRYLEHRNIANSGEMDSLEKENDLEKSLAQSSMQCKNSSLVCESSSPGIAGCNLGQQLKCSAADSASVECGDGDRKWCRLGGALLPDPDLVLVVGEYISSNGFPPWFLRLSEFVSTPRLHKIDTAELTRLLENYSKREQRFGR